jgi:predicted dehydrogenase
MKRFSVAIGGTSFGRSVQAVAFQRHPGFELVALAGADRQKTRRIADELGVRGAYDDWSRLLHDLEPDLASIASPVDLHHPMTLSALESGSHVLCEKPTAMNRFQAAEMRDRAIERGRVGAVNHEFRFFPARRHALDLVRRGAIGVPRRGEILGRYALWPRPESRGMTWLSERARGGGILGALGSHHTDCLRQFFGEPRRVLASVRVDQPRRGPTPEAPARGVATADDACTVHYEFEGGATAIVDLCAWAAYRWERFEVMGSEATLRWDETGYRLWRIVPKQEPEELEIPEEHRLSRREGDPALVAPFTVMVERLHRALSGEAPMEPDLGDAVAVQSVLDAARLSSAAGEWVSVDVPGSVPRDRREAAGRRAAASGA